MHISYPFRSIFFPLIIAAAFVGLLFAGSLPHAKVVQIVLAFLLFVDLASLARGRLQNACIVLASLAFGFAIVEGIAEARIPNIEDHNDKALWQRDADLGYHVAKPGVFPARKSVDGHLAFSASYTIDPGLRRLTLSSPQGPKVRFFGDSFTFGVGLNDDQTLPQDFANVTGTDVLNFGYPGYGPAQALRAIELGLYDKDLEGSRLLILQTATFHVERVACLIWYTRGFPRYREVDGKLMSSGTCQPRAKSAWRAAELLADPDAPPIKRADVELYAKVVESFVRLARQKYHCAVLVLYMNHDADDLRGTGFTQDQMKERFRGAGAMVVDDALDAPDANLRIPYDGHPSALADRLMAKKLADYLAQKRPDLLIGPSHGTAALHED